MESDKEYSVHLRAFVDRNPFRLRDCTDATLSDWLLMPHLLNRRSNAIQRLARQVLVYGKKYEILVKKSRRREGLQVR